MALSLRDIRDAAAFLLVPGQPYPGPLLASKRVANYANPQMQQQASRVRGNTTFRMLMGDTSGDGALLSEGGSRRMRDFASYLSAVTIPTVYAAGSLIAYNFASANLRILSDDNEEVDIEHELPELYQILKQPNRRMDGFLFREFMAWDWLLTGNSLIAKDNFSGLNYPTEMYRLRPDKVHIHSDQRGNLAYGYDVWDGAATITVWYAEDEVKHTKAANVKDPLWGMGIVEAGEVKLSADRRINEMIFAYFDRGAVLDGVLTTDGKMGDDEYDRLLTRWRALRSGGRTVIKTAILWQGAKYQPIQEPMGSVPIVELSKMSRNDVLQLIGVPPQMLGDFEDSNYRNAQEAKAFLWANTMMPMLQRFEPGWTELVQLFDPSLHAEYEHKEILDYDQRSTTAQRLATTGGFTRNDIRVVAGFEPLDEDDPLGQIFICTAGTFNALSADYEEDEDFLPMTRDLEQLPTGVALPAASQQQGATPSSAGNQQNAPPKKPAAKKPITGKKSRPAGNSLAVVETIMGKARRQPSYPRTLLSPAYKSREQSRAQKDRRLASPAMVRSPVERVAQELGERYQIGIKTEPHPITVTEEGDTSPPA